MTKEFDRETLDKSEYKKFVLAWNTSSSPEEVMDKMDQKPTEDQRKYNSNLAARLRSEGWVLRSFSGRRKAINEPYHIGYAAWVMDKVNAGISDRRKLQPDSFDGSLNKHHYVAYGEYRRAQARSGTSHTKLVSFEDWMRATDRAMEPTLKEEELEKIMEGD